MEEKKTTVELLAELKDTVDTLVTAKNNGESAERIDALKEAADAALAAYNKAATTDAYAAWNASEKPMETMITDRYIPGIKKYAVRLDKKTGMNIGSITAADAKVDLVHYQITCGHGNFASPRWFDMAQKLAYVLAFAFNKELSENKEFMYEIDSAAMDFNFAADADPASKKSRVKAIQCCFDAIIPGVRADSHDVVYIESCMRKQGKKACQVVFMNTNKMAELLCDALHHHIAEISYEVLTAK